MSNSSEQSLPKLPQRRADSHKGDYGRALLIGGSRGMAGAIALAGMATLRSGAGLVKVAVPDAILDTVAGFEPSYMTSPLNSDSAGQISSSALDQIRSLAQEATAVACGPGVGRSEEVFDLVVQLFTSVDKPMVLDADALNALAAHRQELRSAGAPRVLTPHPGEFARLLGEKIISSDERITLARQFASEFNMVLVLKGHRTLITDGHRCVENTTGNPGMATGGTGDVLTGVITGLLCQGLSPFDAAQLGAHVHGLAGDLGADWQGQTGLIAHDLLRFLPEAFRQIEEANRNELIDSSMSAARSVANSQQ